MADILDLKHEISAVVTAIRCQKETRCHPSTEEGSYVEDMQALMGFARLAFKFYGLHIVPALTLSYREYVGTKRFTPIPSNSSSASIHAKSSFPSTSHSTSTISVNHRRSNECHATPWPGYMSAIGQFQLEKKKLNWHRLLLEHGYHSLGRCWSQRDIGGS